MVATRAGLHMWAFRGVHVLDSCYVLGNFALLSCKFLALLSPLLPPLCGFFLGKYLHWFISEMVPGGCRSQDCHGYLHAQLASGVATPIPWHLSQATATTTTTTTYYYCCCCCCCCCYYYYYFISLNIKKTIIFLHNPRIALVNLGGY